MPTEYIYDADLNRAGYSDDGVVVADNTPSGETLHSWLVDGVPGVRGEFDAEEGVATDTPDLIEPEEPLYGLSLLDHFEQVGWSVGPAFVENYLPELERWAFADEATFNAFIANGTVLHEPRGKDGRWISYHGTPGAAVPDILKHGLKPSEAGDNTLGAGIYSTSTFTEAMEHALTKISHAKFRVEPGDHVAVIGLQGHEATAHQSGPTYDSTPGVWSMYAGTVPASKLDVKVYDAHAVKKFLRSRSDTPASHEYDQFLIKHHSPTENKFDPRQARDAHGKWATGGGAFVARQHGRVPLPSDPHGLEFVEKLGGGTGAVKVKDADGKRWAKKVASGTQGGEGHLMEEAQADRIYRKMGVLAPNSGVVHTVDGAVKMGEWVEGGKDLGKWYGHANGKDKPATPEQVAAVHKELGKGFALDALLGNWDVIGLHHDNVSVTPDGKPVRIDNGGALRYRAGGKLKESFGKNVPELEKMRNGSYPVSSGVFGHLTDAEVAGQMHDLLGKRKELLGVVTDSVLKKTLGERLDYFQEKLDAGFGGHGKATTAPAPKVEPVHAPAPTVTSTLPPGLGKTHVEAYSKMSTLAEAGNYWNALSIDEKAAIKVQLGLPADTKGQAVWEHIKPKQEPAHTAPVHDPVAAAKTALDELVKQHGKDLAATDVLAAHTHLTFDQKAALYKKYGLDYYKHDIIEFTDKLKAGATPPVKAAPVSAPISAVNPHHTGAGIAAHVKAHSSGLLTQAHADKVEFMNPEGIKGGVVYVPKLWTGGGSLDKAKMDQLTTELAKHLPAGTVIKAKDVTGPQMKAAGFVPGKAQAATPSAPPPTPAPKPTPAAPIGILSGLLAPTPAPPPPPPAAPAHVPVVWPSTHSKESQAYLNHAAKYLHNYYPGVLSHATSLSLSKYGMSSFKAHMKKYGGVVPTTAKVDKVIKDLQSAHSSVKTAFKQQQDGGTAVPVPTPAAAPKIVLPVASKNTPLGQAKEAGNFKKHLATAAAEMKDKGLNPLDVAAHEIPSMKYDDAKKAIDYLTKTGWGSTNPVPGTTPLGVHAKNTHEVLGILAEAGSLTHESASQAIQSAVDKDYAAKDDLKAFYGVVKSNSVGSIAKSAMAYHGVEPTAAPTYSPPPPSSSSSGSGIDAGTVGIKTGSVGKIHDPKHPYQAKAIKVAKAHATEWIPQLTAGEKSALGSYTGSGYSALNEAMRACPPDFACVGSGHKAKMDKIQAALDKAGTLSRPVQVTRGMPLYGKELKDYVNAMYSMHEAGGGVYQFPSFTSSSAVGLHSGFSGNIKYKILSKTAPFIKGVSSHPSENEVLISPKAKFKVVGIEHNPGYSHGGAGQYTFHLEEI